MQFNPPAIILQIEIIPSAVPSAWLSSARSTRTHARALVYLFYVRSPSNSKFCSTFFAVQFFFLSPSFRGTPTILQLHNRTKNKDSRWWRVPLVSQRLNEFKSFHHKFFLELNFAFDCKIRFLNAQKPLNVMISHSKKNIMWKLVKIVRNMPNLCLDTFNY